MPARHGHQVVDRRPRARSAGTSDEFTFADVDEETGDIEEPAATFFGSSDEFFRRFLPFSYRRTIGLCGKGEFV